MKPRLLDLFCGAGGAAKGYQRAGFYVVGVDNRPQPNYCGDEFYELDALDVLKALDEDHGDERVGLSDLELAGSVDRLGRVGDRDDFYAVDADHVFHAPDSREPAFSVKDFAVIHASPPCQSYSRALKHLAIPQPQLIERVRELLNSIGLPWVLENVEGAPLPRQDTLDGRYGIELCGTSFGLRIEHHRLFESNIPLTGLHCRHRGPAMNPHNKESREKHGWNEPDWAREKGITWTKRKREYRDAVPPVFTEHIGHQLMQHLKAMAA